MKKKRTNIYLDEQDKQDLDVLRRYYHLASDAAAVRFTVHKAAEEVRARVSGPTGQPGQDRPTR